MNIKQIITVGVAGMAMGAMALDKVEVTGVTARQRYPWNGLVDIDFTTDSTPTEPYQMKVVAFDNVGKTNLPVKTVSQIGVSLDRNPCVVAPDCKRIVWNAAKDLPNGFKSTNVLITAQIEYSTESNSFCVVDLKTGDKTYLSQKPNGGWMRMHIYISVFNFWVMSQSWGWKCRAAG